MNILKEILEEIILIGERFGKDLLKVNILKKIFMTDGYIERDL